MYMHHVQRPEHKHYFTLWVSIKHIYLKNHIQKQQVSGKVGRWGKTSTICEDCKIITTTPKRSLSGENPRWRKYETCLSIGEKKKQTPGLLLLATLGLKFSSSNLSPSFTSMLEEKEQFWKNQEIYFDSSFPMWL